MKRAVILHAMEQTSKGHWYPWLKSRLEALGYQVWAPGLPTADHPDTQEMTNFLLSHKDWNFSDNLIIGHSSGSVEALYLLQALPENVRAKASIIVSSFDKPVPGMEAQHDKIFTTPFDFKKIKSSAEKLIFVHGTDDPWCPVEGANNLAAQTDGELARAVRKHTPVKMSETTKQANTAEEAADVLIVLFDICNKLSIDLFEALQEKEKVNMQRTWK